MTTKYTKISDGRKAKVVDGALFVTQTNICNGMLEQGGYADRVYKMPYAGTLKDAVKTYGDQYPQCNGCPQKQGSDACYGCTTSDIDRCVEYGDVIRQGRLIL
jgi:hypothetical protein